LEWFSTTWQKLWQMFRERVRGEISLRLSKEKHKRVKHPSDVDWKHGISLLVCSGCERDNRSCTARNWQENKADHQKAVTEHTQEIPKENTETFVSKLIKNVKD
jgi:hypothetical protein